VFGWGDGVNPAAQTAMISQSAGQSGGKRCGRVIVEF
jgi:hypothetical protein